MGKYVINEEFLQQVETLQTAVKNNIAGLFGGNHQSKTYGSSCEFAEHRDYAEGDDITKIDWNLYARFDQLYLKQYYDERQMHTRIYIDASRSMEYGDSKKAALALQLAATLAYLSVCETDKVSVYAIKNRETVKLFGPIVGKEAYLAAVGQLNNLEFDGDSCISEAILPTAVGYGDGMSIILSDFLTDHNYEDAIDYLTGKKRHVFCMQLLSAEELKPTARGKVHFFDSENAELSYRKNIDREIARAYGRALDYVTERIRNRCASRGADYLLISSEDSIGEIIFEKLLNMGVVK